MHLTEWGATAGTEANAAVVLEETARLLFGMPGATGLTLWNLRLTNPPPFAPVGTLYNNDWSLRQTGVAWQDLMAEWDTDLMTEVNPDGTIDFNGFYGDYEITVDGQTYDLTHVKGDALHSLVVAAGDYNGDGIVDEGDYTVWRDTLGTGDLRADGNGNEMIDPGDYDIWKSLYGVTYGGGSGATAAVPEPSGIVLAALAGLVLRYRMSSRRRHAGPEDTEAVS
jgi:hypothetical protein